MMVLVFNEYWFYVGNEAAGLLSELQTIPPLFNLRKWGHMKKQSSKKSLRLVHVAIASSCGSRIPQEAEKRVAAAMESDGRFECQLTSYQNMAGMMNSRKVFGLIILFVKGDGADDLKPEEMRRLKNAAGRIICVAEGMGFLKDAFRIGVFRYVLWKDMAKELEEAVGDVLQEIEPASGLRLTIKGEDKWVPFEDIYYIEAFGDEAIIYKKDTYSTVRKTMDYLLEQLGNAFYRCHKSYIVNFDYVQRIDSDSVILKDARSVPVSVRRRGGLVKIYHRYEEGTQRLSENNDV